MPCQKLILERKNCLFTSHDNPQVNRNVNVWVYSGDLLAPVEKNLFLTLLALPDSSLLGRLFHSRRALDVTT